jgi:hypothetical protein
MTPRTLQAFRDFDSVVTRLSESLSLPTDGIVRDSAILRFELAYEAGWKCVQAFLRGEGVEAASPRQAFAGAFRPPFSNAFQPTATSSSNWLKPFDREPFQIEISSSASIG